MKPVVSICMMVKNEEKNLRRCLESLKRLRNQVVSELIIVDTGSSDNTLAIAKEYTDRIYQHEWQDDFSAMRNISIGYAQGKWIFIIDADEVVEIDSGLIDFLNKTVPANIGGAFLLVKNLTSSKNGDNGHYISLSSPRIFRRNKFFRYNGIVHNVPTWQGDLVEMDAALLHYGYISDDNELMERKFQRTSALLQRKLQQVPEDIYYRFQLAVTYAMHEDHMLALDEIKKAYALCKNDELLQQNIYVIAMLLKEAVSNRYTPDYLLAEAQRGLRIEPEYFDLYFFLAQYHALRHEYDQAIQCFNKYFEIVNNYQNTRIRYNLTLNHYSLNSQLEAQYNMAAIYTRMQNYSKANHYIAQILSNSSDIETIAELLQLVRINAFQSGEFGNVSIAYKYLQERNFTQEAIRFEAALEEEWLHASIEIRLKFCQSMTNVSGKYGTLNQLRALSIDTWQTSDVDLAVTLLQEPQLPEFYWYAWMGIAWHQDKFSDEFLNKLTEQTIMQMFSYLDAVSKATMIKLCNKFLELHLEDYDQSYYSLRKFKTVCKYLLFAQELPDEKYKVLFRYYIVSGKKQVQWLYKPEMLEVNFLSEFKSIEEVFLLHLLKADQDLEKNKVIWYKSALELYPEMQQGIKILLEEMILVDSEQTNEMDVLVQDLLAHVQTFILQDDYVTALNFIQEAQLLAGNNMKLLSVKADVLSKLAQKGELDGQVQKQH